MKLRLSIESELLLAAVLGVWLLLATGVGFFLESSQFVGAVAKQQNLEARLAALAALQEVLVNAETGQRGFLLTGSERFLDPYEKARAAAEARLMDVKRVYAGDSAREADLRRLESLTWEKLTELANVIEVRRTHGAEAARQTVAEGVGEPAMTELRRLVDEISAAEKHGLLFELRQMKLRADQAFLMWVGGAAATGLVIGVFLFLALSQVRQNRLMAKRLQHDANHDYLTGLPNRAHFLMALQHTLERARREETRAAVLYMDLNSFKPINDQLGHEIGDLVLIEVAKKLTATVRTSDLVARLGGDEFVVLVPRANTPREVRVLAERLEEAVGRIDLPVLGGMRVGCSIGLGISPEDGREAAGLLDSADRDMYRAKRSDRRRQMAVSAT